MKQLILLSMWPAHCKGAALSDATSMQLVLTTMPHMSHNHCLHGTKGTWGAELGSKGTTAHWCSRKAPRRQARLPWLGSHMLRAATASAAQDKWAGHQWMSSTAPYKQGWRWVETDPRAHISLRLGKACNCGYIMTTTPCIMVDRCSLPNIWVPTVKRCLLNLIWRYHYLPLTMLSWLLMCMLGVQG